MRGVRELFVAAGASLVLALAGSAGGTAHSLTLTERLPTPTLGPGLNDDAPGEPTPSAPLPSAQPSPSSTPSARPSPTASRRPRPPTTRKPTGTPHPTPTSTGSSGTLTVYGVGYRIAPGGTGVVGGGPTLRRYEVAVQDGLSETPTGVAQTVDAILDNTTQGWLASGLWRFQRVSSGPVDFIVELTTPADTDLICGKYGISTGGVVSCRGGPNVVINLTRWRTGTNGTTSGSTYYSPADYRILVINHEVGHALGHHHVGCGTPGTPAPVMMTQYFGLGGCTPNIWVYVDGTYITGPPTG